MLLARVKAFISKYALLTPGQKLVVGVSGGPDSIALLHILTRLRVDYDLDLIVAHLDHGLRPESGGEAEFVAQTASAWGVASVSDRIDVAALAQSEHLSLEEAGRKARYDFFARRGDTVAVAHHADDQAETVLMHFLRGSGLAGLRGMRPKTTRRGDSRIAPTTIIRPLLSISRTDIETYLTQHNLAFVTDPTNTDPAFFRNRLRHELIPLLETYNPNIRAILTRTATVIAGDHELLQGLVEQAWNDTARSPTSPDFRVTSGDVGLRFAFNLSRFRSLPLALQRALIRHAIPQLDPDLRNLDFTPIDNALHWAATAQSGHTADLLGGLCLSIVADELRIGFWPDPPHHLTTQPPSLQPLRLPGATPFLSHTFTATLTDSFPQPNPDPFTAYLNADLAPFTLRPRRRGDRFQSLGMIGSTKLSDFMINKKIPIDQRDTWPLLCCGTNAATILWVCGYAIAEQAKVKEGSRVVRVSMAKSV